MASKSKKGYTDPDVQYETDQYVFFWKVPSIYSQWTPSKFIIDEIEYCHAEQWMMASKARLFDDEETLKQILDNDKPAVIKKLGRAVKNYDDELWSAKRLDYVVQGNVAKFQQNSDMLEELMNTGDKTIVEASPVDCIWGIGMSARDKRALNPSEWRGQNLLGKAIMEARTILRNGTSNPE
jgi:ribA/ribD-fused uncharacterized protein